MKKSWLVAVVLVLMMALASCSGTSKITSDMNGQTIEVKKGETVNIVLSGNPTTGYNWELKEYDQSILVSAGEPDYKSDSFLIGSGGVYTFSFTAAETGTSPIKLIYYRSFEPADTPPVDTFEVTIVVK